MSLSKSDRRFLENQWISVLRAGARRGSRIRARAYSSVVETLLSMRFGCCWELGVDSDGCWGRGEKVLRSHSEADVASPYGKQREEAAIDRSGGLLQLFIGKAEAVSAVRCKLGNSEWSTSWCWLLLLGRELSTGAGAGTPDAETGFEDRDAAETVGELVSTTRGARGVEYLKNPRWSSRS